jgi:hypothetical protein
MIFIFGVARNMTAAFCFESPHRFKTLRLCTKSASDWVKRQVVFADHEAESFSLREMKLARIS